LLPSSVLGKQILNLTLLKGITFAVTGSSCNAYNTALPGHIDSFGTRVDSHYQQMQGHRNILGIFHSDGVNDGYGFLRAAMKKGMLIDTDHLSQNMRVDLYKLASDYAREANLGDTYPTVGVHSKIRGLEIDPSSVEEVRNSYGFNDETTHTPLEARYVTAHGGTVAVFPTGSAIIPPNTHYCKKDSDCASYDGNGSLVCDKAKYMCKAERISPSLRRRDFRLPVEVHNDCDASSKTFAIKYLWLMRETRGRGLTPSTDFNGLITTLKPRYGRALPWNDACSGYARDHTDQPKNVSWHRIMLDAQEFEFSGVWYEDYTTRSPEAPLASDTKFGSRYKKVLARRADEQREDRAPRALVDRNGNKVMEYVYYNDNGPDWAGDKGPTYREGNRRGAQMYPMKKWHLIDGRAGWDFNLDGFQHIGLYPDLFQDMRNVGVQWEQLGPLFHSARTYIDTWRHAVAVGTAHP
jgi:hypothetical protein